MSARDTIAEEIEPAVGVYAPELADAIIARLEASGRSIVHKDEIHAPSVERCYDIACVEAGDCIEKANKAQAVGNTSHMYRHNTAFHAVSNVADALRELMKEVGR